MSTNFDLAEASIQFTSNTSANWNAFTLPVPANVIVFTIDDQKFKRGDGVHRYSELPDGPSIAGIIAGEQTVVNILEQLNVTDEDCIITIQDEIYRASTTKLTDVVNKLTAIGNTDTIQTANMDAITSQFGMVNTGITTADNGKLAVIGSHKMRPGMSPESIVVVAPTNPINISSIKIYSDLACTEEISTLDHNGTYYVKVNAAHDSVDIDSLSFVLNDDSQVVTSTHLGRGLFKVVVGEVGTTTTVTLTASVIYNADSTSASKVIPLRSYFGIIGVYSGQKTDTFALSNDFVDSQGNIFACGYTLSEGQGGTIYGDALIIKFDANLNILVKKVYGTVDQERFLCLTIDSNDNIFVSGSYMTQDGAYNKGLIIKFDNNLNVLIFKIFSDPNGRNEFWSIAIAPDGNIYCSGNYVTNTNAQNCLIAKFDSGLNFVACKTYYGSGVEVFSDLNIDSNGNIFAVGFTSSEGQGAKDVPPWTYGDGLIVKFDSSLNIVAKKIYGGTSGDRFNSVVFDNANNVYVTGFTYSEGYAIDTISAGFLIKFDNNLNFLTKKIVKGRNNGIITHRISFDTNGNIYLAGAYFGGCVFKLDSNLNLLKKIRCNGLGNARYSNGSLISVTGYINNQGNSDCIVAKIKADTPSGTFVSDDGIFTLTDDFVVEIVDSNLTAADSNLTLSALTLSEITNPITELVSDLVYTKSYING